MDTILNRIYRSQMGGVWAQIGVALKQLQEKEGSRNLLLSDRGPSPPDRYTGFSRALGRPVAVAGWTRK